MASLPMPVGPTTIITDLSGYPSVPSSWSSDDKPVVGKGLLPTLIDEEILLLKTLLLFDTTLLNQGHPLILYFILDSSLARRFAFR